MILDADDLQAIRECCRDDAAFERLQSILAARQQVTGQPNLEQRRDRYEAI